MHEGADIAWSAAAAAVGPSSAAWVFDIEHARMLWANQQGLEFWASPDLAALTARDFSTDMSDATRARLRACLDAIARGEVVEELWTLYPRGVPHVARMHCSGAPLSDGRVGMLAVVIPGEHDPGALRAVEALRHSRAMMTLWSSADGEPLYQSPQALKAFGTAGTLAQITERFAEPELAREIRASVEASRPWSGAVPARTRAGVRWHQLEILPTVDPVSGMPAVLLHEEDVHHAKEIEAQLRESHASLERRVRERTAELQLQERIASVGTLAAGVAHELNNPLGYVMSNLELVIESLADDAPGGGEDFEPRVLLEECLVGARRMARIISELASFARPPTDDSAALVALPALLRSSMRLAAPELRHRARLIDDVAPDAEGRGVDERLGQVFLNLIINAAQAIPLGQAAVHHVRVGCRLAERGAVIEVEDTGCGIDEEQRLRIFEPFFTTKAVGANSGLGLFVCQRIVHEVGGTIELLPRPGGGTIARVCVPTRPLGGIERRHEPIAAGVLGLRILLVDDEPHVRRALARVLRDHDVVVMDSGLRALEVLASGERFDGILCDLAMPETSGVDVYREIETRHPELLGRTLLMTGGAFTPQMSAFIDAHRDLVLPKPIARAELLRAVQTRFTPRRGTEHVRAAEAPKRSDSHRTDRPRADDGGDHGSGT